MKVQGEFCQRLFFRDADVSLFDASSSVLSSLQNANRAMGTVYFDS